MFNQIPEILRPIVIGLLILTVCVLGIAGNAVYSYYEYHNPPTEEITAEREDRPYNSAEKAYELGSL